MGEVIVITSGKGGVGKTTTTANIGIGLAKLGKKVIVIDTDLGLRNLDVVLGLENRIIYNIVDVINGNCRLKQALIKDTQFPELCLLPSAQTKDKSAVSPEQMKKLIEDIRSDFDFVFSLFLLLFLQLDIDKPSLMVYNKITEIRRINPDREEGAAYESLLY